MNQNILNSSRVMASSLTDHGRMDSQVDITKTCLFKYTENFPAKK